jgi:hypothetical protein
MEEMRWEGHVARMREMTANVSKNLKWRYHSEELGARWEDNIRMDLREIVGGGVDWMHLAQDRNQWRDVVNTVMNLRVPRKAENILTS